MYAQFRSRQDLNLRGKIPTDFKPVALTTRPRLPESKDYRCCHWRWGSIFIIRYSRNKGSERIWTTDLSICSRMLYHWATLPGKESSNYLMSSTHDSHFLTLNQVLTSTKAQGEDLEWFTMSSSIFNLTTPWRPLAISKEKEWFPRRLMTKIWYETTLLIFVGIEVKLCSHLEKIASTRLNLFKKRRFQQSWIPISPFKVQTSSAQWKFDTCIAITSG